VQDRVKDLGTLRAIALTSRQAALLVYAETLITGVLAALCSLAVGIVTIRLLENVQYSFDFELSSIGSSLPNSIRPTLFIVRLVTISAISAIFPILAAIIPAHMAQKLTIRESLGI
jgi:ABC-type antimicrobial peptide transport system permease subunit